MVGEGAAEGSYQAPALGQLVAEHASPSWTVWNEAERTSTVTMS
jgi:hypothetical protein